MSDWLRLFRILFQRGNQQEVERLNAAVRFFDDDMRRLARRQHEVRMMNADYLASGRMDEKRYKRSRLE